MHMRSTGLCLQRAAAVADIMITGNRRHGIGM